MLFNKDYDNALALILAGNKKHRKKILEFLSDYPKELYEEIQKKLQQNLEEYKYNYKKNEIYGSKEIGNDLLYWYQIDLSLYSLDLGLRIFNGTTYNDVFELTLIETDEPKEMEYFYDQMIGNLSYDIVEIMLNKKISICNAVENEYNIIKTPIGFILIYSNEDAPKFKFGIKLINRRKIPKDLNLEYLINQNNSSKLTKKLIPTKNNN